MVGNSQICGYFKNDLGTQGREITSKKFEDKLGHWPCLFSIKAQTCKMNIMLLEAYLYYNNNWTIGLLMKMKCFVNGKSQKKW